ncbi:uncharacterized protein LOC120906955 [Anopheles arabiensis]|uniref:uncharacterized protein LOC120906955 n=1 Tax=Anopheles arabiensis TaxID=7173 RepID=UPI001AAD12F4|nr:uncharacterized protein LOC120906955 [Anopheles arabiensis]
MPPWMDKDNENGELKYLVLQMANDSVLPVNPFIVGKTIKDAVGSDLSEFGRKIDSGKKLLLKTRNQSHFEKLQKITKLIDGTLVKVAPHVTLNSVQCVIFAPDLKGLSDEDILENLSDQKVMNVRRFTRKVNGEIVPTNIFLLRINATSIPEFIRLGALQVKTRAYYPKPMQCFKCGQFGHTQIHCKLSPTCTNCGTPAHGECTVDPVCINCKDNHSTTSRTCPRYIQEEQVIKYKIDNNCSYGEARKVLLNATHSTNSSPIQNRITYAQQTHTVDEKDTQIEELKKKNESLEK